MVVLNEGKSRVAGLLGPQPTAAEFRAVAIGEGGAKLSADMTNVQDTIPVDDLAKYPDPVADGVASYTVKIDQEELTYAGKAAASGAGNLTGAVRGVNSTSAAAHSTGNRVRLRAAATQTKLASEIVANGGERRSSPASTRTGGGDTNVTRTRVTTTVNLDTARFDTTFVFSAAYGVEEATVTDDGTVPASATTKQGAYLFRQDFDVVNVGNGDTLRIVSDIKVG